MGTNRKNAPVNPTGPQEVAHAVGAPESLSPEDRRQRIAEAAYLRAAARNFDGGDPLADWLHAEHDVDARVNRE